VLEVVVAVVAVRGSVGGSERPMVAVLLVVVVGSVRGHWWG
jgi:hypothetical protein